MVLSGKRYPILSWLVYAGDSSEQWILCMAYFPTALFIVKWMELRKTSLSLVSIQYDTDLGVVVVDLVWNQSISEFCKNNPLVTSLLMRFRSVPVRRNFLYSLKVNGWIDWPWKEWIKRYWEGIHQRVRVILEVQMGSRHLPSYT